jgi:demethylmenaquinone methyltransferase/2-methoxy-6-polyprenyl-1,4-benzoquinol methylase
MFDQIAPGYDRMNRILTGRMDQRWRKRLIQRLAVSDDDRLLDLACGTGDFAAMALLRTPDVIGVDFARVMLERAQQRLPGLPLVQADALRLPLADESITVAVSGFALRNFVAIPPALAELARVMKPGGRLGLLEVDRPANPVVRWGHAFYFGRVVPLVGGLLSDSHAYRYLPESAAYLPPQKELVAMLQATGFHHIRKESPMLGAIQAVTAERK